MRKLGEITRSPWRTIKFFRTNNLNQPLKIYNAGLKTFNVSICASGLTQFVDHLLDAAQDINSDPKRFRPLLVGQIKCSSKSFRPVKHRVYRTNHPDQSIRIVHQRGYLIWFWTYRLNEREAIWLADLISNEFSDS